MQQSSRYHVDHIDYIYIDKYINIYIDKYINIYIHICIDTKCILHALVLYILVLQNLPLFEINPSKLN